MNIPLEDAATGVAVVADGTGATVKELLLLLMSATDEHDLPIAFEVVSDMDESHMEIKTCLSITGDRLNVAGVLLIAEVLCGDGTVDDGNYALGKAGSGS